MEEAKHFVAFVPKIDSAIANGWRFLGIRSRGPNQALPNAENLSHEGTSSISKSGHVSHLP